MKYYLLFNIKPHFGTLFSNIALKFVLYPCLVIIHPSSMKFDQPNKYVACFNVPRLSRVIPVNCYLYGTRRLHSDTWTQYLSVTGAIWDIRPVWVEQCLTDNNTHKPVDTCLEYRKAPINTTHTKSVFTSHDLLLVIDLCVTHKNKQ